MRWLRLVRAELRKLTTTRMPWGFLAVLLVIAGLDAFAVVVGTDMDGSKGFISTAVDQQSLMAFGTNAMIGTSLFGAIAVAREYGHGTVVPTFLSCPHRARAVLAQLTAILLAGGLLGLLGQGLVTAAVAGALPFTDYGFLVPAGDVAQLAAASTWAGAVGAVLGAGVGALVRNLGGAVTAAVLLLFILPPLSVQLVNDAASWVPDTLTRVLAGVGDQVSVPAALAAWPRGRWCPPRSACSPPSAATWSEAPRPRPRGRSASGWGRAVGSRTCTLGPSATRPSDASRWGRSASA